MVTVVDQIGTELGRTSDVTRDQIELWVEDAQRLVEAREKRVGVTLDQEQRAYVTRLAVVAHARNPTGASQFDVAVDDARVGRRMAAGPGRVVIGDDLWELVGLDEPDYSDGWSGSIPYAGGWR